MPILIMIGGRKRFSQETAPRNSKNWMRPLGLQGIGFAWRPVIY